MNGYQQEHFTNQQKLEFQVPWELNSQVWNVKIVEVKTRMAWESDNILPPWKTFQKMRIHTKFGEGLIFNYVTRSGEKRVILIFLN